MKRILALLMMLAMLLPAAASAAIPDVTGLTNAELEELITVAQEELLWRELQCRAEGDHVVDVGLFIFTSEKTHNVAPGKLSVPL